MLLRALDGGTDRELSKELKVSLPTVKKMWLSVYRRVDQFLPELDRNHAQPEGDATQRGKEQKRHILAYLRKHPEELHPVSQKLLQKAATEAAVPPADLRASRSRSQRTPSTSRISAKI